MSEKEQNLNEEPEILLDEVLKQEEKAPQTEQTEPAAPEETPETEPAVDVEEKIREAVREQEDKYLRLLAEYVNFRKRSARERDNIYADVKADTLTKLLPVFDNLERALKQETADEAYAKGVEMIMTQFRATLEKLGVTEIPAQGETFDPNLHNAVMHTDDESLGENTVAEVFQTGFQIGDKVIRHAMVKVAN